MERLSQLHGPCEIEHDMGAFYSVVLLVSWLSRAPLVAVGTHKWRCRRLRVMRPSTAQI